MLLYVNIFKVGRFFLLRFSHVIFTTRLHGRVEEGGQAQLGEGVQREAGRGGDQVHDQEPAQGSRVRVQGDRRQRGRLREARSREPGDHRSRAYP